MLLDVGPRRPVLIGLLVLAALGVAGAPPASAADHPDVEGAGEEAHPSRVTGSP